MSTRITDGQLTRSLLADLQRARGEMSEAQESIASGRRVNRPSDDPGRAARLLDIEATDARLAQLGRNADAAESRLALEENAFESATSTLMRLRDLAVQAQNGALDAGSLEAIALEARERLGELYDAANARDASGDYLFAGSRGETRPFERASPVVWHGDERGRSLPIGLDRTVTSGDGGAEAFLRVPRGNGSFAVDADAANSGSGHIDGGSVTDASLLTGADYRVEFVSATTFDVVDAGSGATVLGGQSFAAGEPIAFDGIVTHIDGEPAAGDVFHLSANARQDVFATVERFADRLSAPAAGAAGQALLRQGLEGALADIDNALESVSTARSKVGVRLAAVDASRDENAAVALQLARTRSDIEDADMVEAVTRLERQSSALEVLQKSYARVAGLSLFDYL